MEIFIAETVAKRRHELNMTQEELASRLGVSAQAVSNWERSESYPDVTILPVLSVMLGVSVDELLGIGRKTDKQILDDFYNKMKAHPKKQKEIMLQFYREYPKNYELMKVISWKIYRCSKDDPELCTAAIDMSKRILEECTNTDLRLNAAKVLAFLSDGQKAEKYMDIFGMDILIKPNILARRAYDGGKIEKARAYFELEQFWIFLYFCGRSAYCSDASDQGARYFALRDNMIKAAGGGKVPDGLLWIYSTIKLYHSAALFTLGKKEEGYRALEKFVTAYEKWSAFDKVQPLSIGEFSPSGSVTVRRNNDNGDSASAVYVGSKLFSIRNDGISIRQNEEQIEKMFATVLEEDRFKQLFARALAAEERTI